MARGALIFIDTNIFLDFYRIRGDGSSLSILEKIDNNHDIIITGNQVEMEYHKNRQVVILSEALTKIKKPDKIPNLAFIETSQHLGSIKRHQKETETQVKKLLKKIERVLNNPSRNDQVYISAKKLFRANTPYNLRRQNNERYKIRRLARKRFMLGYPPRKSGDNSIGDAINWEWIIECSNNDSEKRDIIIVSRDSDYGIIYNEKSILNDWLRQEFKERVSRRRKIILTDKLTHAFKMSNVSVTSEEEKQEEELLSGTSSSQSSINKFLSSQRSFNEDLTKRIEELRIKIHERLKEQKGN